MNNPWSNPIAALWALYRRPGGLEFRELFGLIERTAVEKPTDRAVRQLMHEGLSAIASVVGLRMIKGLILSSRQREFLESIRSEDFGPPAFADLHDRVTYIWAWQAVRSFLSTLDPGHASASRIGRRFIRKGMELPPEPINVLLGGSAALMITARLNCRVTVVTHAGKLSPQFQPYQAYIEAQLRDQVNPIRWSERDDFRFPSGWEDRVGYFEGFHSLLVGAADPIDAFASLFFTLDPDDERDLSWTHHKIEHDRLRDAYEDIARGQMPSAVRRTAQERWSRFIERERARVNHGPG